MPHSNDSNGESPEDLRIQDYPKRGKVPDDQLKEKFSDPYGDDRLHDGEIIRQLRAAGVAVIRAGYSGGHDEAYYDLVDLFDKGGRSIRSSEEVTQVIEDLPWHSKPETIAVDRAHGGSFSGAGIGQEYGGTIEMRLDTLETRELSNYSYERHTQSRETSEWTTGRSTAY